MSATPGYNEQGESARSGPSQRSRETFETITFNHPYFCKIYIQLMRLLTQQLNKITRAAFSFDMCCTYPHTHSCNSLVSHIRDISGAGDRSGRPQSVVPFRPGSSMPPRPVIFTSQVSPRLPRYHRRALRRQLPSAETEQAAETRRQTAHKDGGAEHEGEEAILRTSRDIRRQLGVTERQVMPSGVHPQVTVEVSERRARVGRAEPAHRAWS